MHRPERHRCSLGAAWVRLFRVNACRALRAGPRSLPASPAWRTGPGYPACHRAPAAGNHRDVTLRWLAPPRCGTAVVDSTAPGGPGRPREAKDGPAWYRTPHRNQASRSGDSPHKSHTYVASRWFSSPVSSGWVRHPGPRGPHSPRVPRGRRGLDRLDVPSYRREAGGCSTDPVLVGGGGAARQPQFTRAAPMEHRCRYGRRGRVADGVAGTDATTAIRPDTWKQENVKAQQSLLFTAGQYRNT
jgi:hypothetical protein